MKTLADPLRKAASEAPVSAPRAATAPVGAAASPAVQRLRETSYALNARPEVVAQRALGERLSVASRAVLQRAAHRPEQGSRVRYAGHTWNVTISAINSPNIRLHRPPNHTVNLAWAQANYTIVRDNDANDHDLRENDLAAGIDAYGGLSDIDRNHTIRQKFQAARLRALAMIKDIARPTVNAGSRGALEALTLGDFEVTRTGPVLVGAGKPTEAAEWECRWVEGQDRDNPRRIWTFVIDSDNPLPTSSQEPHVGWTVSAEAGSQPAVPNTFGHVWLDFVPVMRD
jgi:hypothetical protein